MAWPDIEVNFQSRHGENALIEAVTYRRYDIAKELVSRRDCQLDIVDERDRTPLIMAAQYGYFTIYKSCSLHGFVNSKSSILYFSNRSKHWFVSVTFFTTFGSINLNLQNHVVDS